MKRHPDPGHTVAWSAVGGVVTIVGATGTPVLALAPASAHVSRWLVYVSGAIALVGLYTMLAPLMGWWPWSSSRPHIVRASIVVGLAVIVALVLHGASARTARGHSTGRTHTTTAKHPESVGRATELTYYQARGFTAQIPRGWRIEENEVDKSGEKESAWRNDANSGDSLLIDLSPATSLTLQEDATVVHEAVAHEPDFRELYYGKGDMQGVVSWMWIFEVPGSERIDYFFNRCSTGFAVLGSTAPERFAKLAPRFRSVAESVHAVCPK